MAKGKRTSVYFDRTSRKFCGLEDELVNSLKETYPTIDLQAELNKMILWLNSPKGSQRQGTMNFIINWLNNTKTPQASPIPVEAEEANELRPYLDEYTRAYVWKGREHILAMNKRTIKT